MPPDDYRMAADGRVKGRPIVGVNWPVQLFDTATVVGSALVLVGGDREFAERLISERHYTRTIPSGKSHYVRFGNAVVVWSLPANKNIGVFLVGRSVNIWELSRLWAPDGHEPNLLTQAISAAAKAIRHLERPEVLVSYADPNVGHEGCVYRAASWIYDGVSDESRVYEDTDGSRLPRRSFHSGGQGLRKAEIEALGYRELSLPGKHRYVRFLCKRAAREYVARRRTDPSTYVSSR